MAEMQKGSVHHFGAIRDVRPERSKASQRGVNLNS